MTTGASGIGGDKGRGRRSVSGAGRRVEANEAVTIKEVAERAGVSTATVSYVVNGTRQVRPETRRRVIAAVRDLRYTPTAGGRRLQCNVGRVATY
jgi:transcriptional regulator with XRE-family HTH domain